MLNIIKEKLELSPNLRKKINWASKYTVYLISNNKPYRVNVGYPLKEFQIKEYLNELNKYHATNFCIHLTFNYTINDIPDKITFDLEPNEKIFRLIPIIKYIDNPENGLNKFKLGIVITLVDTISNRANLTIYMDIKKSTLKC